MRREGMEAPHPSLKDESVKPGNNEERQMDSDAERAGVSTEGNALARAMYLFQQEGDLKSAARVKAKLESLPPEERNLNDEANLKEEVLDRPEFQRWHASLRHLPGKKYEAGEADADEITKEVLDRKEAIKLSILDAIQRDDMEMVIMQTKRYEELLKGESEE